MSSAAEPPPVAQVDCSEAVYRRWPDDGFTVRRMSRQDAQTVIRWYSAICPTSLDLDIALEIQQQQPRAGGGGPNRPGNVDGDDGFYVGELNGELVASKVEVPVAPGVRYGSLFYVDERLRMRGYGRRINDVAAEVGDRQRGPEVVCIDAHDELEAMNHRRGYTTGFKVTQYKGVVKAEARPAGHCSDATIEQLSESQMTEVVDYDNLCFVSPSSDWRRRLLSKWIVIPRSKSVVARSPANGAITGFGCRRPAVDTARSQGRDQLIGPLYADSLDVASDLMDELTQDVEGQTVWINICESHDEAVQLVQRFQLTDSLHMLRMYRGTTDPHSCSVSQLNRRVFALTSIDICGF